MKRLRDFREFHAHITKFGNQPALTIKRTFRKETLTYKNLADSAARVANYLKSQGVTKQARIMIVSPNMPEWPALFLGSQLLGVAVVPVDARSNLETVKEFMKSTTPKLIFKSKFLLPELDQNTKVRTIEDLFRDSSSMGTELPPAASSNQTALIVFTSGTTAAPKGVILSQANLLSNLHQLIQALIINPKWRFLSVLPLSHTYELTTGCLAPISAGAQVFYMPRIAPLAIGRALRDYKITSVLTVPLLLTLFLKRIKSTAREEGKYGLLSVLFKLAKWLPVPARRLLFAPVHKKLGGKLKFFATGGAPVEYETARDWELMGVKIIQGYGLTETSPVLTMNTLKKRNLRSQGRTLPGISLRLSNDGEIQAKGDNVFSGYLDNTKANQEAFTTDGYFRTGDVGKIDGHGWIYVIGRKKFAIVLSSGLKVYPENIERVALRNPQIKDIAVVGLKTEHGEVVHAVIMSDAKDSELKAAIGAINSQLEEHKRITSHERWPEEDFPRTRLLKVDRKKVWDWANQRAQGKAVSTEELVTIEDKVISVLSMIAEKPARQIKEDATMEELGLDSLRRLTAVSLLEEQMSVSIPEAKVTADTRVSRLRGIIKESEPPEAKIKAVKWTYHPLVRVTGKFLRAVLTLIIQIFWVRIKVEGRNNLRNLDLPAIFIFNHVDGLDTPVVYKSLPGWVRNRLAVAAAQDVMSEHKWLAFSGRLLFGAYDFARVEPFVESLEHTGKLIDRGYSIAIAPEGKLSRTGELQPFKSGTGMLAVEMAIPVVPVKTEGLYGTVPLHHHWPVKSSRAMVKIGRPLWFAPGTSYAQATKVLESAMRQL